MLTARKEKRHYIINLNELGRMHLQMGDAQQAFERVEAAQAKALSGTAYALRTRFPVYDGSQERHNVTSKGRLS